MRRLGVAETHSINMLIMAWNSENRLPFLYVVDIYRVVSCTCYDLSTITGEPKRPDLLGALDQERHITDICWSYPKIRIGTETSPVSGS